MSMMFRRACFVWLWVAAIGLGVLACDGTSAPTDGDAVDGDRADLDDATPDGDLDPEADGDADHETELSEDGDRDFEYDPDGDVDAEPDRDGDTEPDQDLENEPDADLDIDAETDDDGVDDDSDFERDAEDDLDLEEDVEHDEETSAAQCQDCSSQSCPTGFACVPDDGGVTRRCWRTCPDTVTCPENSQCVYRADIQTLVCRPDELLFCAQDDVWRANACGDEWLMTECVDGNEYCVPDEAAPYCDRVGGGEWICDDSVDDDSDGATDCGDIDCAQSPACCDFAYSINCGDYATNNSISVGELDYETYSCSSFAFTGPDVVYRLSAPFDGTVTASLSTSVSAMDVMILETCSGASCLDHGGSQASASMREGDLRFIAVDGANDSGGAYTLHVTCSPDPVDGDIDLEADGDNDTEDDSIDGDETDSDPIDGDETESDSVDSDETEADLSDGDIDAPFDRCADAVPLSCGQTWSGQTTSSNAWLCDYAYGTDRGFSLQVPDLCMVYMTLESGPLDADLWIADNCDNAAGCTKRGDTSILFMGQPNQQVYVVVDALIAAESYPFELTVDCQCDFPDGDVDVDADPEVDIETDDDGSTDLCYGIPYEGCCIGPEVVYCEFGELNDTFCANLNPPKTCGWVSSGYYDCGGSGASSDASLPLRCADYTTPVVINELVYDEAGSDTGAGAFIELYGPAGTSLTGCRLIGVDGVDNSEYASISLDGKTIPGDGYFVVAHTNASGAVRTAADLFSGSADLQNGPDALRLICKGIPADELGYGSNATAFETAPAADVPDGSGLARRQNGVDTDNNSADFGTCGQPTPGASNVTCF